MNITLTHGLNSWGVTTQLDLEDHSSKSPYSIHSNVVQVSQWQQPHNNSQFHFTRATFIGAHQYCFCCLSIPLIGIIKDADVTANRLGRCLLVPFPDTATGYNVHFAIRWNVVTLRVQTSTEQLNNISPTTHYAQSFSHSVWARKPIQDCQPQG